MGTPHPTPSYPCHHSKHICKNGCFHFKPHQFALTGLPLMLGSRCYDYAAECWLSCPNGKSGKLILPPPTSSNDIKTYLQIYIVKVEILKADLQLYIIRRPLGATGCGACFFLVCSIVVPVVLQSCSLVVPVVLQSCSLVVCCLVACGNCIVCC